MAHKGYRHGLGIAAAVGLLAMLGFAPVQGATVHHFSNGICATIYGPQEIATQWTTETKEGVFLMHPIAGTVELDSDGKTMVPFRESEVVAALEAMHGFVADVDVSVFILAATPAAVGSSFARRGAIFLSPGSGPIHYSTEAYITTHEMGHVLTWAFLDDHPARWKSYLEIRGLDESSLLATTAHADRAREILAEDIRALFGGAAATASGSIENHELAHPSRVEGLEKMLTEFFLGGSDSPLQVSSRAFPNPCNPMTSIEMSLPAGLEEAAASATLKIFDIRGALVNTLGGGQVSNGRLVIPWAGTGRSGEVAPSGRYLYVLEVGQLVSKGAVTLVR